MPDTPDYLSPTQSSTDSSRPGSQTQSSGRPKRGKQAQRLQWLYSSRVNAEGGIPPGLIATASVQRHQAARKLFGAATLVEGPGSVNWMPLGPSVITHGQAYGFPNVSGRITGIAVGPDGSRVYVGAANGGVWFSCDGGTSWASLDDSSSSPNFLPRMEADSLAVGALAVRFGTSLANDTIYVGTGEPRIDSDQPFADSYFGVGIRSSTSGGAPGSWNLEATNLAGHGIFKILIDPDDPGLVYAATSCGLFKRPTSGRFTSWNQMTGGFPKENVNGLVSDVIVAGKGTTKCYYAAFWNQKSNKVVYSSPNGITWTPICGVDVDSGRIVLAASESDPPVIYALADMRINDQDGKEIDTGTLYRLNGNRFQQVSGVPRALFAGNQGDYDIVLAADPADTDMVYLGGSYTTYKEGTDEAVDYLSLYKGKITDNRFPFKSENDIFTDENGEVHTKNVPEDATWIGLGIHADAHSFAFATKADGTHDGTNVWVGTDGGLFQSTKSGERGSFIARNTGLAITQMTYIAQQPDKKCVIFGGSQDNGTLRYSGEATWFESVMGDGGGVAIDPNNPAQIMCQSTTTDLWTCTDCGASSGSWTKLLTFSPNMDKNDANAAQKRAAQTEHDYCAFYGPIAVSPFGVSPTLVAFGTHRIWLTEDWGQTWKTLPTGTDPYKNFTDSDPILNQDQLVQFDDDGKQIVDQIVYAVFASDTYIFAATRTNVWRFRKTGEEWSKERIPTTTNLPGYKDRIFTALAVENPTTGSFYATLGGSGFDHVWYFDGTAWESAGLTVKTLDAPAHAVVVDLANPQTIYIGTDVGCWKGTKKAPHTWEWNMFSQGLPESAITDLAIHAKARLLRAATHGRGVWEIRLGDTSVSGTA